MLVRYLIVSEMILFKEINLSDFINNFNYILPELIHLSYHLLKHTFNTNIQMKSKSRSNLTNNNNIGLESKRSLSTTNVLGKGAPAPHPVRPDHIELSVAKGRNQIDWILKKRHDMQLFAPTNFTYAKLLGEGAFGKVRHCNYK